MPDAVRAPARKTPAGLAQRIFQWVLALTIAMLLNTLAGAAHYARSSPVTDARPASSL